MQERRKREIIFYFKITRINLEGASLCLQNHWLFESKKRLRAQSKLVDDDTLLTLDYRNLLP